MHKLCIVMGLVGIAFSLTAQDVTYGTIPEPISAELSQIVPVVPEGEYPAYLQQEEDTFATYVFTTNNIVIFSYEDSTALEVHRKGGGLLWSGVLDSDEYQPISAGSGVFLILGNKEYSALVGDPLREDAYGWYAVDQHNRAVSTKLMTVYPPAFSTSEFIVFAYEDSTTVEVFDYGATSPFMSGVINAGEVLRRPADMNRVVMVTADKPVSALTYSDQGYWVPAANGTFAGQLFYAWIGYVGGWNNDLTIIAYSDETHVKVSNTEGGNVLWEGDLDDGEIHTVIAQNQLVTIESDKNVTCLIAPYTSFTGSYYRLYIGMDASGEGIGNKFYHPTIAGCQLYIFSFYDNNQIRVSRQSGGQVWSGTLNSGEYTSLSTSHGLYQIESDRGVGMFDAWGDIAGADFAPLWFAVHPEVAVLPDQEHTTEPRVTTRYGTLIENNGNYFDIVNIRHHNTNPSHFSTDLSDLSGGTLPDTDGDGYPDTDTLLKTESFTLISRVTPSDSVPFNDRDTLVLTAHSFQDTAKVDTAFLVTYIREVDVLIDSSHTVDVFPEDTAVFNLQLRNTSIFRVDNVNLTFTDTKGDPLMWPVRIFTDQGVEIFDTDGDGLPDIPDVPIEEEPVDFQVRVGVPSRDFAQAGDQDTVFLVATSSNLLPEYYPMVGDTDTLIVNVLPEPAIRILPTLYRDSVESGRTIRYAFEVSNNGNSPDVADIRTDIIPPSFTDWSRQWVASDGTTPLTDTDADSYLDVGQLGIDDFDTIFLDLTPARYARDDDFDTTVVYAVSSVDPAVMDSSVVITQALFPLVVVIDIEPDMGMVIGPGDTAVYDSLIVTNMGSDVDTIVIGTNPLIDLGWEYDLTFADGSALLDVNGDGREDLGSIDSAQSVYIKLVVRPPVDLGEIVGVYDTTVVETRYVWVETGYASDTLVRDTAVITTIFEPIMDIHNYPNPFPPNAATTFAFTIPRAGDVSLRIYNRAGEHIVTLIDEHFEEGGVYTHEWDGLTKNGTAPAPGVYLYTLDWRADEATGLIKTKRKVKKLLIRPE